MRDRINSVASSTAKTLRSIVGEAVVLQQEPPTRSELVWGISARASSIPVAAAALACLVIDWHYAVAIGKDWNNTFFAIAVFELEMSEVGVGADGKQIMASSVLNIFLFVNMLLRLQNSPRAAHFRRYLAYVDLILITLLVSFSQYLHTPTPAAEKK